MAVTVIVALELSSQTDDVLTVATLEFEDEIVNCPAQFEAVTVIVVVPPVVKLAEPLLIEKLPAAYTTLIGNSIDIIAIIPVIKNIFIFMVFIKFSPFVL